MQKRQLLSLIVLFLLLFNVLSPSVSHAASPDINNIISSLTATTAPAGSGSGGGMLQQVFDWLFNTLLGPIFNASGPANSSPAGGSFPAKITPLPSPGDNGLGQDTGVLKGKVIVVDPGHGGSNPGAVANNTRESDNNLAVGLKLRDKLASAGAKVIMTRDTDRTVAPEGSTLDQELQARVDIAESNHADMFVSVHSNENSDPNVVGAETFYPDNRSQQLASNVQTSLVGTTGAQDKGTAPATFYVLHNTTMPSILVEMGFVSNANEARSLQDDQYRGKIAQGIVNGIVQYFKAQ